MRVAIAYPYHRAELLQVVVQSGPMSRRIFSTYGEHCVGWRELCVAHVQNPLENYEGIVHPTVLDNCLQICSAAPSGGMTKKGLANFIPNRLRET
jgi:hypothetical protein